MLRIEHSSVLPMSFLTINDRVWLHNGYSIMHFDKICNNVILGIYYLGKKMSIASNYGCLYITEYWFFRLWSLFRFAATIRRDEV